MATPAVHGFHKANMEDERRRVMLRIANGTKASSPKIISQRRQHPQYKGMVDNSTGSRTSPFFNNTNQRDCPFASLTGGVIKDYKFARALLDQRAKSTAELDALREGMPPAESPLLELSDVESRSLELNNFLQQLQDFVEVGDVPSSFVPDLKNILRLYIALIPTFSQDQISEFMDVFNDLVGQLDDLLDDSPNNKANQQTREFIDKLFNFTREFARFANEPLKEKKLAAAEILKRVFKISFKGLRVPQINLAPPRTGLNPIQMAIQRQEDEDDDDGGGVALEAVLDENIDDAANTSLLDPRLSQATLANLLATYSENRSASSTAPLREQRTSATHVDRLSSADDRMASSSSNAATVDSSLTQSGMAERPASVFKSDLFEEIKDIMTPAQHEFVYRSLTAVPRERGHLRDDGSSLTNAMLMRKVKASLDRQRAIADEGSRGVTTAIQNIKMGKVLRTLKK